MPRKTDAVAEEGFLKDLISAARLRSAWETLLRRMQIVERSVTNLREVCDREALERDFVLWPTFDRRVEKEHTSELRILSLGLDDTKINLDRRAEGVKGVKVVCAPLRGRCVASNAAFRPRLAMGAGGALAGGGRHRP